MKLLITNPDAIVNPRNNEYYDGIITILNEFIKINGNKVLVISMDIHKLSKIPKQFNPNRVTGKQRKGKELLDYINKNLGIPPKDCIILATKTDDMVLAANSQLILLRADYTRFLNVHDRLYTNNYGILGIHNPTHLGVVLSKFYQVKSPWYYTLNIDEQTTLYSLTNANTLGNRQHDAVKLALDFKSLLKNGDLSQIDSFTLFFMISIYSIFEESSQIDHWCVYPSSSGKEDIDLEIFVKKMRESFKKFKIQPILSRTKQVRKRRETNGLSFLDHVSIQLSSIEVNKDINLEGKCICVIDDFTTTGSSCETVRLLLRPYGVRKIIFITMGKFGREYTTIINDKTTSSLRGEFNDSADLEFIKSLKDLF